MIRSILRYHWPAVLAAVLVGFVLALPPLILKFGYGIPFNHPANIRIDDEFLYFARIREVLDGYPLIGNAYLAEHKAKPPSPLFLGEWILAAPPWLAMRLLGFADPPIVAMDAAYDFFFPAAAALLTYACLWAVARRRWLALGGTAFLFFGLFPSDFARIWSPQLVFLFWLSQFLLLFSIVRDPHHPRRRLLVALGALNFGLNVYLYPYTWTFYAIAIAIAAASFFLRREALAARTLLSVLALGFALAIPYFLLVAGAARLPEYLETLYRISMIDSRFPSGIAIVLPGLGILAVGLAALRLGLIALDRRTLFLASGVVAAMVAVNQHLLTGKNFEFSSHYLMPAAFWFTFAGVGLLSALRDRWPPSRRPLGAAALMLVIGLAASNFRDVGSWSAPPPAERLALERYQPVLDWVAREVEPDAVVLAPLELSQLIPIYTAANVAFAPPVRTFLMTDEEVMDRFIANHFFSPFDGEFIARHARLVFGNRYLNTALHTAQENRVLSLFGLAPKAVRPLPEVAQARLLERVSELRALGFERVLENYRVEYLIWDRVEDPAAPFDRLPFLEESGTVDGFRIYAVR